MSYILSRWRVWETYHVKAHRCHQLENLNPKAHNSGARRLPMLGHYKKSDQLRIPSDPKIQCIGVLGGAKSAADAAPLRLCQGRKRGALDHLHESCLLPVQSIHGLVQPSRYISLLSALLPSTLATQHYTLIDLRALVGGRGGGGSSRSFIYCFFRLYYIIQIKGGGEGGLNR